MYRKRRGSKTSLVRRMKACRVAEETDDESSSS